MKWNESGFRPPLCTYRLNWARRTSWGWWDDWDDTVLQTQDSKFEPWRSEAEHATSRSRRLPTILTFTRGWGRNIFVSFKPPRPGIEPRTLAWKAVVLTTTLGPPPGASWSEARKQARSDCLPCQAGGGYSGCQGWARRLVHRYARSGPHAGLGERGGWQYCRKLCPWFAPPSVCCWRGRSTLWCMECTRTYQ